jgi:uncharacterized protein
MAIKFGGEFEVQRSPEEVYDFLTNPEKFGPLLPDFKGMSVQDPTHFTVKVNVGVSYIKGTAEVKMTLAEAERPRRAKYTGQGSVPGGGSNIVAGFDVAGVNGGTKVTWAGEAQVFGKLASIAGGLLEPLGKKNIQKLIDSLQAALTATGAVAAGAVAAPAQAPPPDGDVTKLAG